jgi:hypothetical protein
MQTQGKRAARPLGAIAWREIARPMSRADFEGRFPGWFLLSSHDGAEPETVASARELDVGWIARLTGLGDPGWISVGRDPVCDVLLRHRSVSKVHAHFQRRGDELVVVDARSKNGTSVNDWELISGRPRVIAAEDSIRFGHVLARVRESGETYDLLTALS